MGAPRALNDISFVKTNGGLGRYNGSDDAISGLIFGGLGLSMVATTQNETTSPADVAGFDAVDTNTYGAASPIRRSWPTSVLCSPPHPKRAT